MHGISGDCPGESQTVTCAPFIHLRPSPRTETTYRFICQVSYSAVQVGGLADERRYILGRGGIKRWLLVPQAASAAAAKEVGGVRS